MPLNVDIPDPNYSLGPETGFFYYVSSSLNALVQIEADGTVVDTFPITRSRLRNQVRELHYDGTYFWTIEDLPSDLGLVIKKWRITPFPNAQGLPAGTIPAPSPTDFQWQGELTLIHGPLMRYASKAFAVEHYHRTLAGSFTQGQTVVRLNDVSNLSVGDTLNLGPSSFAGFEDHEEDALVLGVDPGSKDVTLAKAGGLDNSYTSNDPVDFLKSLWLLNDNAFSGEEDRRGNIIQYSWPGKTVLRSDQGMKYYNAGAADFDNNSIFWVRADQIMEIDLSQAGFDVTSSNESNLRESDRTTIIEVFDLISDLSNNQHLKLQEKETTESVGTGFYTTVSWVPKYNYQVQPTQTIVNSTNLGLDKRFVEPFSSGDTITVTAEVRDQYNFPVFNETVQFAAALNALSDPGIPGTFNPVSDVTNSSGIVVTTYTPSTTVAPILVDITAQVL
jgi:hypothetical protein